MNYPEYRTYILLKGRAPFRLISIRQILNYTQDSAYLFSMAVKRSLFHGRT
jgi:hypothetical protein